MCAEYPFRNAIASLMLTPLFGIPSGVYRLHHRVMHHVVSTRSDLSSSEAPDVQKKRGPCVTSATSACVCCFRLAWRKVAASNNIIPGQQGRAAELSLHTARHSVVLQLSTSRAAQELLYDWIPGPDKHGCLQEDNMNPKDLSSTEPYQRDNLAHFFM